MRSDDQSPSGLPHAVCSGFRQIPLSQRPFDVLTESVIRNFKNEDQTITIHDPNSGKHITVPTLARGTHRKESVAEEKDF